MRSRVAMHVTRVPIRSNVRAKHLNDLMLHVGAVRSGSHAPRRAVDLACARATSSAAGQPTSSASIAAIPARGSDPHGLDLAAASALPLDEIPDATATATIAAFLHVAGIHFPPQGDDG